MIVQTLMKNAETARRTIARAIANMPATRSCHCGSALQYALITRPEVIPDQVKRDLAPIVGRYLD
jgi:5'-methylthioadenosine phosphorylase